MMAVIFTVVFGGDGGPDVTIRVHAKRPGGTSLSEKDYILGPRGVAQYNVSDVLPGMDAENVRLHIEVRSGGVSYRSTFQVRIGDLVAGRYHLERLLGSGGMAQVWEATDQTLGRKVAVRPTTPLPWLARCSLSWRRR